MNLTNKESVESNSLEYFSKTDMKKKIGELSFDEHKTLLNIKEITNMHFLINSLHKINNLEDIYHILIIIYDIFKNQKHTHLILELDNNKIMSETLFCLLNCQMDLLITKKTSKIIAHMIQNELVNENYVKIFCKWCVEQLQKTEFIEIIIGLKAIRIILHKPLCRLFFQKENGIEIIAKILDNCDINTDILYLALYNLWLLSFQKELIYYISSISNIIGIIRRFNLIKILRISIAILRNLLGKVDNNKQMIEAGALDILTVLSKKKYDDEDIEKDINIIIEELNKEMITLNTFTMYKQEIISGNLKWNSIYRTENFWKENIIYFEENDFEIIKILIEVIKTSNNPIILSIICSDIGEFVRFHPRGRKIISKLDVKVEIMKLLSDLNVEVQKHSLLCLQKIMIQQEVDFSCLA